MSTELTSQNQEKYRRQIDILYQGFENRISKFDTQKKLSALNNFESKVASVMKRKLSEKNIYILSYLKWLINQEKDILTWWVENKMANAWISDVSKKPVSNDFEDAKNVIRTKLEMAWVKVEFYDTRKEITDKCLVEPLNPPSRSNANFTTVSKYAEWLTQLMKEEKTLGNSKIQRELYFYLNKDDLVFGSAIYANSIPYSSPLSKTLTSYDSEIFKGNLEYTLLDKGWEKIIEIARWNCSRIITQDSYKEYVLFSELSDFLRLLNTDKQLLIKKMISTWYYLHFSKQLIKLWIVKNEDIVSAINLIRSDYKLPPLSFDAVIEKAAINHSKYLETNEVDSGNSSVWCPATHEEDKNHSGFTWINPGDRLRFVGYQSWNWWGEVIAFEDNPIQSLHSLLYVPYHRTPFLSKNYERIGFSRGNPFVVNFWSSWTDSRSLTNPLVFPNNNEVLYIFNNQINELPNPFPQNSWYLKGYVITIGGWDRKVLKDSVKLKNITTAKNIPIRFDKELDSEGKYLHFINLEPLNFSEGYQIIYRVEWDTGDRISDFHVGSEK